MKKLFTILLVLTIVLSGCTSNQVPIKSTVPEVSDEIREPIEKQTSMDITGINKKLLLGLDSSVTEKKQIQNLEPMYNIQKDMKIIIKTNLESEVVNPFIQLLPEKGDEYIAVYSDREMTDKIPTSIDFDTETKEVIIYPLEEGDGAYARPGVEKPGDWGGLKTYYLAIRVDLNKPTITKLESPQIKMFTVKSHIDSPTVKMVKREDGNYKLVWDEIKGAKGYKVYSGGLYNFELLAETNETEFLMTEEEYLNSTMNSLLTDSFVYSVAAYNDEGEGLFGNLIKGEDYSSTAPTNFAILEAEYYEAYKNSNPKVAFPSPAESKFGLQQERIFWSSEEENSGFEYITDINDLPTHVKLNTEKYIGSEGEFGFKYVTEDYAIQWDLKNATYMDIDTDKLHATYTGYVLGTSFTLEYIHKNFKYVDGVKVDTSLSTEQISEFEAIRDSSIPKVVTESLDEKIEVKNTPTNDELDNNEKENNIIDTPEVIIPEKELVDIEIDGETLNIDTNDLETVIAIGMLNYDELIHLSKFKNEVGDGSYLSEILKKIMAQYPLIIGELEMSYDFITNDLLVVYNISKEDGQRLQTEVLNKANQIVKSKITTLMTDYEKHKTIHDYLLETVTYDRAALDDFMKGISNEELLSKYGKSFNVSGAILDGLGVCQSYAEAYKLLSDIAGLKSVVVYGDLQNVPHAWNKVYIEDGWYHVDVTNNDNGIPYPIYSTSDDMLPSLWVENDSYIIKSEYKMYRGSNNTHDYYVKNEQYASNKKELITLLKKSNNKKDIYIKLGKNLKEAEVISAIKEAFGKNIENYEGVYIQMNLLVMISK